MGSNITPDAMRGFLIPSALITKDNIWEAQSTFQQSGARAGFANPQQAYTGLTVVTTGDQAQPITITTNEGGTPGEKASFV